MSTLSMSQLAAISGLYPSPGDWPAAFTAGMIQSYAGERDIFGAPPAIGQLLPISRFSMLYPILGTAFGGDGRVTFALPDLDRRSVVGGQKRGMDGPDSLTMTYLIATASRGVAPFVGAIVAFGGTAIPSGWLAADGAFVSPGACPALFDAIGTTFGGDGEKVFALPNLDGVAAVGTGAGVALGQKVAGRVPGLGLNYAICTGPGIYPSSDGRGAFPDDDPFLGQVLAYAGSALPKGWMACNGAMLPVAQFQPLFSLIGYAYGGSGPAFALPNLAGRRIVGGTPGATGDVRMEMSTPEA